MDDWLTFILIVVGILIALAIYCKICAKYETFAEIMCTICALGLVIFGVCSAFFMDNAWIQFGVCGGIVAFYKITDYALIMFDKSYSYVTEEKTDYYVNNDLSVDEVTTSRTTEFEHGFLYNLFITILFAAIAEGICWVIGYFLHNDEYTLCFVVGIVNCIYGVGCTIKFLIDLIPLLRYKIRKRRQK